LPRGHLWPIAGSGLWGRSKALFSEICPDIPGKRRSSLFKNSPDQPGALKEFFKKIGFPLKK